MDDLPGHGDRGGDNEDRNGRGTMVHDLKQAAKGLLSTPTFTLGAIATLALGIGAAVATFSVVHSVVLKDLPYSDPDRLVTVWPEVNYNIAMVDETLDAIPGLESLTGSSGWGFVLTDGPRPTEIDGRRVTPGHFEMLGVLPLLGRSFEPSDALPDAPGVTILSHALWVEAFGGGPDVLGRMIQLSGADREVHEVVGVMPAGFRPTEGQPLLWTTLRGEPGTAPADDDTWFVNTRIGRLAEGATHEVVSQQLRTFANRMHRELPRVYSEEDAEQATVEPLSESVAGDLTTPLWLALGAVGLVLLSACANVANLLLARGQARAHAFAVRSALGADRQRIVTMLLGESAIVGVLSGLVGVAMSYGLVGLIVRLAPSDFVRLAEVEVGSEVLAFAVAVVMLATMAAGLIPALRSSRVEATAVLGRAGRGTSGHRSGRLMPALVAGQVAMAVVVATGSGLMLRSLATLLSEDPGMEAEGVLTFRASPGEARLGSADALADFYGELIERLKVLPGVTGASAIHLTPGTLDNWSFPTYPEGHDYGEDEARVSTNFRVVWPDYFETVGIPLLEGRTLSREDRVGSEMVVVVNRAFVDRWWPGESALGKTVRVFGATEPPARVAGVVGDVRQFGLGREPDPELYYAHRQWGWAVSQTLVVKFADGDPLDRAPAVRRIVAELDALVPVSRMERLNDVLGQNAENSRFLTLLLTTFGALAVVLGAVGVFGVTAYAVGLRVPEYGVRMALGASRSGVVGRALATAGRPVLLGLGAGVLAALIAARFLAGLLYRVTPADPVTFVGVSAFMATVGLLAALVPALRAGRVDPVEVLAGEG